MRPLLIPAALAVIMSVGVSARAEHAKIHLEVSAPGVQEVAFVDQTPPEYGKNPRPILKVKAGDPIKVMWTLENIYPHKTLENVVVHFFVARQDKVGQKPLPKLDDDVVHESAFDMDFKPGTKAGARMTLRLDTPGTYLMRVESKETQSDHEHFAAIDIVVEKP
jgi:hypothetical protein